MFCAIRVFEEFGAQVLCLMICLLYVNVLRNVPNKTFPLMPITLVKDLVNRDSREYFGKLRHWKLRLPSYV